MLDWVQNTLLHKWFTFRNRLRISLLILSEFKQIFKRIIILFPLNSSEMISGVIEMNSELIGLNSLNLLTTNVPHHIETSPLICISSQLTSFHMMGNIGR